MLLTLFYPFAHLGVCIQLLVIGYGNFQFLGLPDCMAPHVKVGIEKISETQNSSWALHKLWTVCERQSWGLKSIPVSEKG